MADPISMIAIGGSIASGVVGAMGASAKGDAQEAMYNYKAGVAQANKIIAGYNADYAIQAGGVRTQQLGLKGAQQEGQIRAIQGASGLDVNKGSAKIVQDDQRKEIVQAQGTSNSDAQRKAYGYKVEGMNFEAESRLDTSAGQYAQEEASYNVASSLLGGATGVADKWSKFSRAGAL